MAVGTFVNLDCKESEDSGFRIPDSGFQGLDSGFFVDGAWILVSSNCWVGFWSLWAVFWFQKPKIYWIPDSKCKGVVESGIRNPSRGAKGISWLVEGRVRLSRRGWKLALCYCIRHPHNDQTFSSLTVYAIGHVLWLNEQAIVCDAKCLMFR